MRLLFITLLLITTDIAAQDTKPLTAQAYQAYEARNYAASVGLYTQAFAGPKQPAAIDLYNAACSAAMANEANQAFLWLNQSLEAGWENIGHLQADKDLTPLHTDTRWAGLLATAKRLETQRIQAMKLPQVYLLLDSLVKDDQQWRMKHTELINKGVAHDAPDMQTVRTAWRRADSLSLLNLQQVVTLYGFLGYDKVGKTGSRNFWLLMQHCDKAPDFQEKVLGLMKTEVDHNNASPTNYAYLIDRVRVNTHRPQVYGTQMMLNTERTSYTPILVEDPANLNKRRAEVGLETIEAYTERMNRLNHGSLKK
jgi:hypothetical protein